MANYNLVINSKFQPFSFERYLQPYALIDKEYRDIESQYSELEGKADVWEKLANEQTSPEAYNMYKKFSDDLRTSAETLAKTGLTPQARREMLNMKRRYSSEIVPIEQAYAARGEQVKQQQTDRRADKTVEFSRDASMTSLDDYINNPHLSYEAYSGKEVMSQVGKAAANLANVLRNDPRWRRTMAGQYWETMLNHGVTPEEILLAASNDPNAPDSLRKIVNDAIESTGVKNWKGVYDKNGNITEYGQKVLDTAYSYANQGLWESIGKEDYKVQANRAYGNSSGNGITPPSSINDKYYSINPKLHISDNIKDLDSDLTFIEGLIANPKSIHEEKIRSTMKNPIVTNYGTVYSGTESYYPNQERLLKLAKKYNVDIGIETIEIKDEKGNKKQEQVITNLDSFITEINKKIKSSAIRENAYTLNMTDSKLLGQVLATNIVVNSRGAKDKAVGVYEINNKGKVSDKEASIDDVTSYINEDTNVILYYDPSLNSIVLTGTADGKTKTFKVDPDIISGDTIEDPATRQVHNKYQKMMIDIDALLKEGNIEKAKYIIDGMMNTIYSQVNSVPKVQSNTDSKI